MIDINPNRINVNSGTAGKLSDRRRSEKDTPVPLPKRAQLGVIPAPESLATMIRSAVAALRQGSFWDRGTILNVLV